MEEMEEETEETEQSKMMAEAGETYLMFICCARLVFL